MDDSVRTLLIDLFTAGVAAVQPDRVVAGALEGRMAGSYDAVIATGKAAPGMARAAAPFLGEAPGLVVSDQVEPVPDDHRFLLSDHPVPGRRSVAAGTAVLDVASRLGADDRLLYLLSGGTSALIEAPVRGVEIEEIAKLTRALLHRGATIHELNAVRSALSLVKGGGLARAAAPASVTTLAISDVIDDDPAVIGSGPTTRSSGIAARDVIDRYGLAGMLSPAGSLAVDVSRRTPTGRDDFEIVASGRTAARAAASHAAARGLEGAVHPEPLFGEARDTARDVVAAFDADHHLDVLVMWGETTVTVSGTGVGGRNQEGALAAAIALDGRHDIALLAAGTDGIDGATAAAGAVVAGSTVAAASRSIGDPHEALRRNDSGTWLSAAGAALVTGPTGTNVGDLWILLRTRDRPRQPM
ncbi:MAG: glycerate kinase [Acidimicrobiia bacterium]